MTCRSLALMVALLLPALRPAAGTETTAPFRFQRSVELTMQREELIAAPLDADLWDALNDAVTDLRVVAGTNTPVAYLLTRAMVSTRDLVEQTISSHTTGLTKLEDERMEIGLMLASNTPPAAIIVIRTPLRDFERRLSVDGIDRDGTRHTLVEDALIYDYSEYMDVRHTRVVLPANQARRFEITISAMADDRDSPRSQITRRYAEGRETELTDQRTVTRRPFRIDGVTCLAVQERERKREARVVDYAIAGYTVAPAATGSATHLLIETPRAPLTSFLLDVSDRNFGRRVAVEIPTAAVGADGWRRIAETRISRVAFRSFRKESLSISLPETRSARYRLVIENGDSPALTVTGVTAKGPMSQVCFLGQPGTDYRLMYGAADARLPRYDTDALRRLQSRGVQPAEATLGAPVANPDYREPPRTMRNLLGSRAAFILGVLAVVAVLAVGLIQTVRKAEGHAGGGSQR